MSISKTIRPGLIQIRVLDLAETLDFYTRVLGLTEVGRTSDGRVMLKCYDEFDHHSVTLRLADTAGFDYAAWKVDSAETLESMKKDIEAFGYPVTEIAPNSDQPGYGKRYAFKLCTGHRFDIYADVALAEDHPPLINPDLWNKEPHGMRATRFDHMLLYGPNISEAERFCKEVFGMYSPEVCNLPDGKRLAVWLTGNNKPHDLAFVEYETPGKVHHIGFYLESWEDIGHAADLIAINRLKLDIGPTRHAITRGKTIYFWEPSGNRIETYSGGYTANPDNPVREWDLDNLGRGLFYYSGELIPSFLGIVT